MGDRTSKSRQQLPRPETGDDTEEPGRVRFDDRGNAVYEWADPSLTLDGAEGDRLRDQALAYAGLSIVDEEPASNAPVLPNQKGARVGYNPYESGLIKKPGPKKKTDLRELSKWIEMQKKLRQENE